MPPTRPTPLREVAPRRTPSATGAAREQRAVEEASAREHLRQVAATTRDFARRNARRVTAAAVVADVAVPAESEVTAAARAETTLRWAGYTPTRGGAWSRTEAAPDPQSDSPVTT